MLLIRAKASLTSGCGAFRAHPALITSQTKAKEVNIFFTAANRTETSPHTKDPKYGVKGARENGNDYIKDKLYSNLNVGFNSHVTTRLKPLIPVCSGWISPFFFLSVCNTEKKTINTKINITNTCLLSQK